MTKRPSIATAPAPVALTNWRDFKPPELSPILDVALREIVAHGYDATSVRVIAEGVGVTVPALYYHFKNKQAILVALLDHAMDIVTRHVFAAVAEAGEAPPAQLAAVVEALALYMAHHRDLAFLDSERRALTADNLRRYVTRRDRVEQVLRDVITGGCVAGAFATGDPEECGRAILSMCQGIAIWFRPDGPTTPGQTAERYASIALAAVETRLER